MDVDGILEWATEPRNLDVLDGVAAGVLAVLFAVLVHLVGV